MSESKETNLLHITYLVRRATWLYAIANKIMKAGQSDKYNNSPLPNIGRSIDMKLGILKTLIDDVNLELRKANKELRENKKSIDECIKRRAGYSFSEMHRIFRLIAYSEAVLINMKSAHDFIIMYLKNFYTRLLGEKKDKLYEDLKTNKIELAWVESLSKIRNDINHRYTTWLAFKKTDTAYNFVHLLPKSLNSYSNYKKFKGNFLDTKMINEMLKDFFKFHKNIQDLLFKKINEKYGV